MIPKFRAWLKDVGEMVEVLAIDFYNKEAAYIWTEQVSDYELEQTREVDKIDDLVLMQYTGLKDKNGVEIFEGDEIELTHSDLEGETIYSKVIAKAPMDYTLEGAVALNYAHEIELTGKNIYENTELLEVANQ